LRNIKTEFMALLFGAFVILLTFGDNRLDVKIGNLDTIFGLRLWPVMDILYPFALIVIFIYYGHAKGEGKLRLRFNTILSLLVFLVALTLICIDDVFQALHVSMMLSRTYWIAIMWLFPLLSCCAFFIFGEMNRSSSNS
jgi:hypothetical protein